MVVINVLLDAVDGIVTRQDQWTTVLCMLGRPEVDNVVVAAMQVAR